MTNMEFRKFSPSRLEIVAFLILNNKEVAYMAIVEFAQRDARTVHQDLMMLLNAGVVQKRTYNVGRYNETRFKMTANGRRKAKEFLRMVEDFIKAMKGKI